jgi:hypothetical protein
MLAIKVLKKKWFILLLTLIYLNTH